MFFAHALPIARSLSQNVLKLSFLALQIYKVVVVELGAVEAAFLCVIDKSLVLSIGLFSVGG